MTPEEQARHDRALRSFAAKVKDMASLGFDPTTTRKGVITAIDYADTPPTVSLLVSGDTDNPIDGVRVDANCAPYVGQTVLVGKQGKSLWVHSAIASDSGYAAAGVNGWIKPTLTNGNHGGNSNGDVMYRRVLDNGSWAMQWQGGWEPAGTTLMLSGAQALDPAYRPSRRRTLLAARNANVTNDVKLDFATDGTVILNGATTDGAPAPDWVSLNGLEYFL